MNSIQQALTNHINTVLFNQLNPNGKRFRHYILNQQYRRQITKQQCKQRMLTEAQQWAPHTIDTYSTSTVHSGRLYGLHTEVTVNDDEVIKVYVEID